MPSKKKRKAGRPVEYHDDLHRYWREKNREYRAKKQRKKKRNRT